MRMSEASRGAQEAGGNEAELLCGWACRRPRLALEAVADDGLDAADVDQIEAERAPAGAVDPVASVLVHHAQQLLRLTQARPWEAA